MSTDVRSRAESVRYSGASSSIPICDLDDALSRLASYVDALDWLLSCPPEERELIYLLMNELRRALDESLAARDALFEEEGRGR